MAKRNAKHAIKAPTLAILKTTGFVSRFENQNLIHKNQSSRPTT
jgi:hypothetical protein